MLTPKTPEELIIMRQAGRIWAAVQQAVREAIRPGITGLALDALAEKIILQHGAKPTFKGHHPPGVPVPYPNTLTVSVNHELVHGIPNARPFEEGDLVSIDCGVTYQGYVADAAFTVGVGRISEQAQHLLEAAEGALMAGIQAARAGKLTSDVSKAIQAHLVKHKLGEGIVRELTGHGVGQQMWEPPSIPNWWPRGARTRRWRTYKLVPGVTMAIEPMVSVGKPQIKQLDDHWTLVMADGSLCCHVEHTIAVTDEEPLILTLP